MNINKSLVAVMVFTALALQPSFAQENMTTLGAFQYAQFDGTWYTVIDGGKGDLVDTMHLVVRLKGKAEIETFDFAECT